MPYIKPQRREAIDAGAPPEGAGELAYVVSKAVDEYLSRNGVRFASLGEAITALEASKLELYRRVVGPYEFEKMRENGEVFTIAPDDD